MICPHCGASVAEDCACDSDAPDSATVADLMDRHYAARMHGGSDADIEAIEAEAREIGVGL